jgi:hypothetical protein
VADGPAVELLVRSHLRSGERLLPFPFGPAPAGERAPGDPRLGSLAESIRHRDRTSA